MNYDKAMRRFIMIMREMRVYQWTKNILLFVPILASHQIYNFEKIKIVFLSFISFSLIASAIYIFNDIVDIKDDRNNRTKRKRPLASGELSIFIAWLLIFALLTLGGYLAIFVSTSFIKWLGLYTLLAAAYTIWLKKIIFVDVLLLASFYTLRIFAGGEATATPISKWLLIFSLFFFFGLALIKRLGELTERKNYFESDRIPISSIGITSSICSTLIFALYVSSAEVSNLYIHHERLWFALPLLLYWICRIWILSFRGKVDVDPVVFALKDQSSYLIVSMLIGVFWWAI